MKIAVYGSGGVGGYFGGLLANASHDVTFIARGEHLRAIQQRGLRVRSVNGDFDVAPARASDDPSEVGPVDYVVVGLKQYHLASAAPDIAPLVGSKTTVVPLLNGVDAHEILIDHLGRRHVVGGFCSLSTMVEKPGLIRQTTQLRRVVMGELDRSKSERVERLVQAWAETGVEAIHADDIFVALWTKLAFIASFGGVTALARCTAGELRATSHTRDIFISAMREVESLARKLRIDLATNIVETIVEMVDNLEFGTTTSMQRDVEAGRPFELEAFSGTIHRMAQEANVETPVHSMLYALLKPALDKAMKV
ncbi:MAG: 2-dehydropantoate 2-reductase [Anaerolineales bacterium]